MNCIEFDKLINYLIQIPGISEPVESGNKNGWWVKFSIDIKHPLSWHVVQGLGHVLNYLSLNARLPTVFKPVSPPPYLNGGPSEYLSWVIECDDLSFRPETVADWLKSRLPKPIDDFEQWSHEDDD